MATSLSYALQAQPCLFLVAPHSPFARFLVEVRRLVDSYPEILDAIEKDLDRHALAKKMIRVTDKNYHKDQVLFPDVERSEFALENLRLQTGRPRMSAEYCLLFLMVCTYAGGPKSLEAANLLYDSLSVELVCREAGIKAPGRSTLAENLGTISDETRQLILDAQIALAKDDDLDDFKKLQMDSTHVAANVAWPTESGLIWKMLKRTDADFKKLAKQFPEDFFYEGRGNLIRDLKALDFQINCTPKHKTTDRKALYNIMLDEAEVATQVLAPILTTFKADLEKHCLKPSCAERLQKVLRRIDQDLNNLDQLIQQCHERINEDTVRPVNQKVLSISDPDAAYMKKGDRPAEIGYHPQLARSEKGFITAVIVPKGYAQDASMFRPVCEQAFRRMGAVPESTSTDGGYASKENRAWLLEQGVKHPSFSSSKGKAITPEEDWNSDVFLELRHWRSAAEAMMSHIKGILDFGDLRARGIEKVRAELTNKVIAFNFIRSAYLRNVSSG